MIDILRGCNIRCRDCYNLQPDQIRPLAEIEAQLDTLLRLRRLQSVSIVGGEPTLHPDLVEIVRRVRRRGLFVELFSNGVALTDDLLIRLKRAGANVIFLHVESGQRRPDLPANATAEDIRRLRTDLAARVAAHGIEVGLASTAYPERMGEVEETVSFTLATPAVSYLLVTWWRDVGRMPALVGDLAQGMTSVSLSATPAGSPREIQSVELCGWLERRFAITPFAFLGSNFDASAPRWLSFLVGTVHRQGRLIRQQSVQPTGVERTFLKVIRRLTGRYPFYQKQQSLQTGLHLLLNGLASGPLGQRLKFLAHAARPGAHLGAKRLLFQWPASIDEHGRVVHCDCCPDAVLKEGKLVPLCISDRVHPAPAAVNPP
ncbi:MAG: radical SAM protein [Opitutaceae bacterium]|nr:radical SAM protein [Opitutaceae bacterium]